MDEKYSYKYIRMKIKGGTWSGIIDTGYQAAIDEQAARGWRFVQAFAPAVAGYGSARFVDLIFEKRTG